MIRDSLAVAGAIFIGAVAFTIAFAAWSTFCGERARRNRVDNRTRRNYIARIRADGYRDGANRTALRCNDPAYLETYRRAEARAQGRPVIHDWREDPGA